MWHSIRTRSVIIYISLAVIPLLLVGIALGGQNYRLQRQQALLLQQEGVERTTSESLTVANSLVMNSLGLFIATVLAGGIGIILARRMTEPIQALVDTVQAISRGDLIRQAEPSEFQELTDVSNAFNSMTAQLQESIETLEKQVQHRTHHLRVSLEISNQIVRTQSLDTLLSYVVNRIQTGYNFYHTQIYLADSDGEYLVLAEGSGEIGQKLKAYRRQLVADEGIVGSVYHLKKSFLSNNVDDSIPFVKNSLLPETKSELALVLRSGEQMLGVLDIQSDQINRFTPDDLDLIQALADQTAVAITNIRLLAETQIHRQEVQRLNRRLTRDGWQNFAEEAQIFGYRYEQGRSIPITTEKESLLSPSATIAPTEAPLKQAQKSNGDRKKFSLTIPLVLRGEIIGALDLKREENAAWADEELDVVQSVADQLARAVDNARLAKTQEKTIVQLQEIDRLKSDFLTSVSHELRTPLNSIIGFADILLQGIDGELTEYMTTDITAIYKSGRLLLELINGILDLSKIEEGRLELNYESIDVLDAFIQTAESVSSLLQEKPVDLIIDAEAGLSAIWADSLRLNQILLNLVSNAIKFTDEGTVTIRAKVTSNSFLEISVQDTGIGIPEDKLKIIFDRFQQVDSSNNRRYQGTGVGLAIAKQLTELHGGQMWAESIFGAGSTFYFTMPLAQAEALNDSAIQRFNDSTAVVLSLNH